MSKPTLIPRSPKYFMMAGGISNPLFFEVMFSPIKNPAWYRFESFFQSEILEGNRRSSNIMASAQSHSSVSSG